MSSNNTTVLRVFDACVMAILHGELIQRVSTQDKEFHFQNWLQGRLIDTSLHFELGVRNSYPDFRMVHYPEGYEVKGLAYPGRETTYDSNSQIPSGMHNGRAIYYVFGRYPEKPDGNTYPVLDIVICHGDFLNVDHEYIHQNRSVRGFGSYGDILIRDRKMYVAPTPFGVAMGLAHARTLILPEAFTVTDNFERVGTITRRETNSLIVGYSFDLRDNTIHPTTIPNPFAGREHVFHAWRLRGDAGETVTNRITVASPEVDE